MARRSNLVKSVLTSIAIYFITILDVPMEVLMKISSLRRAFLWVGCDKVTGGKCKLIWDLVCKPTTIGGLGIINLKFLPSALCLRWLWNEWSENPKTWVGLGNPCNKHDRDQWRSFVGANLGRRPPAHLKTA
jgi:hypothetical protein